MRVLFTTTPGLGHVHPMVPLARAFLDQGDEVLWAASGSVCGRLEKEGFRAAAAGLDDSEGMQELFRRFPEVQGLQPTERPLFMFPRLFGTIRTAPMLDALLPIVHEWRPSVVIRDAAEFAGPIAAATIRVPSVTHSFGALLPAERLVAAADRVAPLWEAQGLAPRPYGGSYDHLYLDIYPGSLQAADTSHVPDMQQLRPVSFAGGGDEDLPKLVTEASGASLVYVTFGTVFNKDLAVVATVVEALRDLPIRIVVTLGPQGQPEALGPQPANVHVARYIPQTDLLARCTAVVSHAGSGTFLAALTRGLPQLCLPQAADQFINAAACARSGAGLALHPGTVTVDNVRSAAEQLLSDTGYRAAAGRLSAEIGGMPGPEDVAEMMRARFRDRAA